VEILVLFIVLTPHVESDTVRALCLDVETVSLKDVGAENLGRRGALPRTEGANLTGHTTPFAFQCRKGNEPD
jgi:hypothetical protein